MDVGYFLQSLSCPLSLWPRGVLSTSWCCPPRPCVVFLARVHMALFLALSLFLVSSWRDLSVLASLLWRCLTVAATTALLWTQSFVFLLSMKPAESLSVLSSQRHLSESPAFTAVFTAKYFFIIRLLLSATWVTDWQLFNCIHSAVVSRETTADTKSYCCISQSSIDTFGHLRNWNLPFFIFNCFGHSLISRQTTWSCVRLTAVNFDLRFTCNLVGIKVNQHIRSKSFMI